MFVQKVIAMLLLVIVAKKKQNGATELCSLHLLFFIVELKGVTNVIQVSYHSKTEKQWKLWSSHAGFTPRRLRGLIGL